MSIKKIIKMAVLATVFITLLPFYAAILLNDAIDRLICWLCEATS